MFTIQVWLKKKDGMAAEEFRRHWLEEHAPIARDGYEHLKSYTVGLVTGAPRGHDVPYDGLAELTWDSREEFLADITGEVAQRGADDLANFTAASGVVFVERHVIR